MLDVRVIGQAVEHFLYEEAALLDEWRLEEWLELLAPDIRYTVPCTDKPGGDPDRELVLLDDDMVRVKARVNRLLSRRAHREFPWSRTRRLITNVRVIGRVDDRIEVTANFVVYRIRNEETAAYIGRYLYRLVEHGESYKISFRRAELDLESLHPHGTVSFIL
jgi:p-cumate 2,3-dioxygenase beta subunit